VRVCRGADEAYACCTRRKYQGYVHTYIHISSTTPNKDTAHTCIFKNAQHQSFHASASTHPHSPTIHVHSYIHTYIHIHICAHIHAYVRTYIHIYSYFAKEYVVSRGLQLTVLGFHLVCGKGYRPTAIPTRVLTFCRTRCSLRMLCTLVRDGCTNKSAYFL
jgi:hypothetical protein